MDTQVADIILHETGWCGSLSIHQTWTQIQLSKVGVGTLLRDYTTVSSTDREHYLDDLNGMGDTSNGDYCGGKYMIIMVIAIMNP